MSDILKGPDQVLAVAICGALSDDERLQSWAKLHRHLLAGGPLPAQWRGEGTAVGKMIDELQGNAYVFHLSSCSTACDVAETDWRELKSDAEIAIRAVTGEG